MMLFQGYNWIRIFALLGMVTYAVNASPLSDSLGTTLENAEAIKAALARGTYDSSALQQLIHDAELALKVDTFSVTDNPPVPPSGSRNDYYSWAPYWWPDPNAQDGYPYISRDGKTNPETERKSDKPLLRRMAMAVQTLALAYYYTDDHRYADKALTCIRSWFLDPETRMNPNLNYAQCVPGEEEGRSSGIIDTRWLIIVIDALPLLTQANPWTSDEMQNLKAWFADYLDWLLTSPLGQEEAQSENNHATWYAAQVASFALFTDNEPLAQYAISSSRRLFESQLDSLGRQIHELRRTKSFDYSLYNIHALITLARIGEQVNIDLWRYRMDHPKNLYKSIHYMADSYSSDEEWPYPQISERVITLGYEDGLDFSVYYPYDLYTALQVGYKIYHDPLFHQSLGKIPPKDAKAHRSNLLIYSE